MAGAFFRSKGITVYCINASGVTDAEMSDARRVKGTCQYRLVIHVAGPTLSVQSSIRGKGNESVFVTVLTLRKSEQNLGVSSDFGTITQGEL